MRAEEKGYPVVYADIFKSQTPRALAHLVTGESLKTVGNEDEISSYDYSRLDLSFNREENLTAIHKGDIGNVLAYISVGDRKRDIERLISALAEIKRRFGKSSAHMLTQEYISPVIAETPRKAFYAAKRSLPLEESAGHVCSEFVMCYPPGIPILAPGELITPEIIEYIRYAKEKGCQMTGTEDINIERLNVLDM